MKLWGTTAHEHHLCSEILYKYALGLTLHTKADFPQLHLLLKIVSFISDAFKWIIFQEKSTLKNTNPPIFLYSFKDHSSEAKWSLVRTLSHPTWSTNNTLTNSFGNPIQKGPVQTFLSQNDTTEQNKTEKSKFWQFYTNCGISSSRSSNCCIRFSRGLWQVGVPSGRTGSSELSLGWPLVCTGQANVASESGSDFVTWIWGACTRTGGTAIEGNAVFSSVPLTLKVGLGGL